MFRSYAYSENVSRIMPELKPTPLKQPYTCDICEESQWLSETDVELHRKENHFEWVREQMTTSKERFCTICMKLQDSHSALVAHVKTRHLYSSPEARRIEREIFICNDCNHIFFNKDMLQAHIMYSHLWGLREREKKYFTCPKCRKSVKLKTIWFHFQMHEIPSISVCEICLTHFDNLEELTKHLKTHPMYLKCEICCYHAHKEMHYDMHIDQHHKSPFKEQRKIGKVASRVFRKQTLSSVSGIMRYNIQQSLRGLDLPRSFHVCILCREICTDKIEVQNHLVRDHLRVARKRRVRCICGEQFFNRVLLRHHIFKVKGDHREVNPTEVKDKESPQLASPAVSEDPSPATMETISVSIEQPASLSQFIELEDLVPAQPETEDELLEDASGENLTYIYAEIDEDQLVTIDSETNEEVIGF